MINASYTAPAREWRPIFWEPVEGTGERIMVGVVYSFDGQMRCSRVIRDDVLDSLYGSASAGARKLIDSGLEICRTAADATELSVIAGPLLGLHPGPLRCTEAATVAELLRTACLLYSSLANLDKLDDDDDSSGEETARADAGAKRFQTEVRNIIVRMRPDLRKYFNRRGAIIENGQEIKFGFLNDFVVAHFGMLHPVHQPRSMNTLRGRLWELRGALDVSGSRRAALVAAVPAESEATLGERQLRAARENVHELELEADKKNIQLKAVMNPAQGAEALLAFIGN